MPLLYLPKNGLIGSIDTPFCGNGRCEPEYGENCSSCPQDCYPCCGDGSCRGNENCDNCPQDCYPSPTPTPPPSDPCPCKDDPEIEKLLSNIETQKEMVEKERNFIQDYIREYEDKKRKYEEEAQRWADNFNKSFSPEHAEWWISTLMGFVISAVKKIGGAEVHGKDVLQDTLLTKFLALDAFETLYFYNKVRADDIEMQINKHIRFLHYHGDLCEGYTRELLKKCSCAIEKEVS